VENATASPRPPSLGTAGRTADWWATLRACPPTTGSRSRTGRAPARSASGV